MKVFIGSNDVGSNWRETLNSHLKGSKIEFIQGVKEGKGDSDFLLYVVTPKTNPLDTIINVVNDSNVEKAETIFCYLAEEDGAKFTEHQVKSLLATGKMIELNGGKYFTSIEQTANYIARKVN